MHDIRLLKIADNVNKARGSYFFGFLPHVPAIDNPEKPCDNRIKSPFISKIIELPRLARNFSFRKAPDFHQIHQISQAPSDLRLSQ
jgi:hypothetical protein